MNATDPLAAEADSFGVPFVPRVDAARFDPALIAAIPVTWAREQAVLPARLPDGRAVLLMPGTAGLGALQQASLAAGAALEPAFAPRAEILRAIDEAYFAGKARAEKPAPAESTESTKPAEPNSSLLTLNSSLPGAAAPVAAPGLDLLLDSAEPVARFLNDTLLEAIRRGASDVHVDPTPDGGARVRFRLSGRLYDRPAPPRGLAAQLVSRVKVLAGMDIAEHRLPQDGMTQVRAGGGRAVDIRVSTIPVADGERVVMRLLNRDDSLLPLADLGMPDDVREGFSALLAAPNGIVVVSGPTGSGKTTTLYAALGSLDATRRNVMTIEDPVEYRLPGIAQIQVAPKIGLTFASGLRHILRQDPDVVLVGETRDAETAEIAVRASLTGHLVFTTLHTNDAPSAAMRLVDMGVEPYLLASCLRGVLAQRLVRRACPHCAKLLPFGDPSVPPSEEAVARAAGAPGVLRAVGCDRCLEGYVGRIGVFELLRCGGAVAEAIHAGRLAADDLRQAAAAAGLFRPMADDAARKLRDRVTTPAEVLAALGGL